MSSTAIEIRFHTPGTLCVSTLQLAGLRARTTALNLTGYQENYQKKYIDFNNLSGASWSDRRIW